MSACALLGFAAISAFFGLQEARFQYALYQVESEIDSAPLKYRALSLSADDSKLAICDANFQFVATGLLQVESIADVIDQCGFLANAILQKSPTHSFAHLIAATSDSLAKDHIGFAHHIALSQRYGRFEGWLSQRRYFYLSRLGEPPSTLLLENEIGTMLAFQRGSELLVEDLHRAPSLQPVIFAALKAAELVYQQRFLNLAGAAKAAQ